MPRSVHQPRLSQPTLFHPPHRHPSLQAFPPEIRKKTIRLMAALLRVHVSRVVVAGDAAGRCVMSDKISAQHLAQSHVVHPPVVDLPREPQCRKLAAALCDAGPLAPRGLAGIEVVDEDLGRSAAGMVTRAGFERMVAEVCFTP